MDDAVVISEYSLKQAIADGVLARVFESRWPELSGNKPIVATAHVMEGISLAGIMEIWNEYVTARKQGKISDD